MPTVNCPDCGHRTTNNAAACVHCGRPMQASTSFAVTLSRLSYIEMKGWGFLKREGERFFKVQGQKIPFRDVVGPTATKGAIYKIYSVKNIGPVNDKNFTLSRVPLPPCPDCGGELSSIPMREGLQLTRFMDCIPPCPCECSSCGSLFQLNGARPQKPDA